MSKKKIDHPKVFISYAWGTEEYQERVLAFANQLVGDGVDVIIDRWDLSEGNDTYAFMEKCANDESITNVLMLIDPVYAQKADAHSGGVGTETQIISAKVYQEVAQDKFIPIVFGRDENGKVRKPVYLQGRLHFDLSQKNKYDIEYVRLVKKLYGEEVYKKPELGGKPTWVEESTPVISVKVRNDLEVIKTTQPDKAREILFSRLLSENLGKIPKLEENANGASDIISEYKKYDGVKETYLNQLEYAIYVNNSESIVAKALEAVALDIQKMRGTSCNLAHIFVHELFLYTVAFFMKNEDYLAVGKLLGRTYSNPSAYGEIISGFSLFYSGRYDDLDIAVKQRDGKNYYCGTATYWIENLSASHCSKEQFLMADLICFNYSIYGKDRLDNGPWFPITYVYDSEDASVIGKFTRKFVSRDYLQEVAPMFGYDTLDSFIEKLAQESDKIKKGAYRDYRYPTAWNNPAIIDSFIDLTKVASVR